MQNLELPDALMEELVDPWPGDYDLVPVYDDPEAPPVPTPKWKMDSLEKASWVLRKMQGLEEERAEKRRLYEQRLAMLMAPLERLEAWWADENTKLDGAKAFWTGMLHAFHGLRLEANPKEKTITLPEGKLELRAQPPQTVLESEEQALAFAKAAQLEALVRVKEDFATAAFNALIKNGTLTVTADGSVVVAATGEVVPGVRVESRPAKFAVKLV